MKRRLILAIGLALAGCQKAKPDPSICDSQDQHVATVANDLASADDIVRDCVLTWGYRLASGSASNGDVARATLHACDSAIQTKAIYAVAKDRDAGITSSLDEEVAAERKDALDEAFFRAVSFRAGRCAIPRYRSITSGDLD